MTDYPPPPGYVALLARRPDLAFTGREPWPVDLALLRHVNRDVNRSMTYRAEPVDVWGEGSDCEDFALAKLEALQAAGVPRGAMRFAACRVDGRGHAVLVVNEEWVLTNGRDDVFSRHRSKLRLEAWEAEGGRWERIGSTATLADLVRK